MVLESYFTSMERFIKVAGWKIKRRAGDSRCILLERGMRASGSGVKEKEKVNSTIGMNSLPRDSGCKIALKRVG